MKVGIVGTGMVGSAAGASLLLRGVASELVLVDKNEARARAEAADLAHAMPFASPCRIDATGFDGLSGARAVILACGVAQKEGETRLQLLSRNADVFREVVAEVRRHAPDALLLVASNPVDVMTMITRDIADLPAGRVIGSGTILDTARFRVLLGRHLGIAPGSIHANVLGEHGDSEVLAWSSAEAGTLPLADVAETLGVLLTDEVRGRIDDGVRGAAGTIIEGKGATWWGIGGGLARLCAAIGSGEDAVLTVSTVADVMGVRNVAVSLPRVVGSDGVTASFAPSLDDGERAALERSARIIAEAAGELG